MRLIVKLLLAQYRRHAFRSLVALSAVVTSVTMVIVLVGQQVATVRGSASTVRKLSGSYQLLAVTGSPGDVAGGRRRANVNPPQPLFKPDVLQWIHAHPDVRAVDETCEMIVTPSLSAGPDYNPDYMVISSLFATGSAQPPRAVTAGHWLDDSTAGNPVVVDSDILRRLQHRRKVGPGDAVTLVTSAGRFRATIAGVLDSPGTVRGMTGFHVRPQVFAMLAGQPAQTNRVMIALKDAEEADAFMAEFDRYAESVHQPARIEPIRQIGDESIRTSGANRGTGAWFFPLLRDASAKLAVAAAFFVIFNTFSMGLQERTRQLAMLRAIGMTRLQIASTVLCDGAVIATIGCALGVGLGILLLPRALGSSNLWGVQFTYDVHLGLLVALGAATAYGSVFFATLIPAVLASRKRPLEGMSSAATLAPQSAPWWLSVVALALIALNPLASIVTVVPDSLQSAVIVAFSFITAVVGFVLVLPLLVRVCEAPFVQIAARLLALNPRLLQRHLSGNLWRTVGCVSALMVGLGLYILVNVWGRSMAVPFMISPNSPDAIVTVFPGGVPDGRLNELPNIAGVRQALPMILRHPVLADLPPGTVITGIDFFGKDMMYFGCDAVRLLDPETGMLPGKFVRGTPAEAFGKLAGGSSCLITDSLYRRFPDRYDVGQTITLDNGEPDHGKLTYTIAGVVEADGWHQFTKRVGLRRNGGRSGGLIIVPPKTARAAYPGAAFQTLWFKLDPATRLESLEKPIVALASRPGPTPTPVPTSSAYTTAATLPAAGAAPAAPKVYCRIVDSRNLVRNLRLRIDGAIGALAYYPLWALVLASVAVVNTMFASVRARSWEIGILRSIGLTRGQVVRQVLAEGLLIGLLAAAASLLFGLLTAYTGIMASCRSMNVTAPYVVPWHSLGGGLGLAVALCVVATLLPALLTARRQTLRLLQEGRSMD